MKAMRLADSGATAALVEENVPQPQPGRGAYTGEVKQRRGRGKLVTAVVKGRAGWGSGSKLTAKNQPV